jgi:hypothetical protein
MALEGDVTTLSLRELLGWLAGRRGWGTLSLSRGMEAWQLQLRDGSVLLASSPARDTLLGRLLVERGLIAEAELAKVLERGRRSRARIGRTLVRDGLVSEKQMAEVLAEKVRRVLADALTWQEGRFFFDDHAPTRSRPSVASAVDLAALLRDELQAGAAVAVTDADVIEVTEIRGRRGSQPLAGM